MFPSEADRILSRYRRIAPKLPLPLPIPPSASSAFAKDLSASTCASPSLDSLQPTSSAKIRRTRKRRIVPATFSARAVCPKLCELDKPQVVSTLSASSVTQGNSDRAVPLIDFSYGAQESTGTVSATQPITVDLPDWARPVPEAREHSVGARFHPQTLVDQARMFMMVDALKMRHPSLDLRGGGYPTGAPMMEKDVAFMERAAASSVLPEKGAPSRLFCNATPCPTMKGGAAGYAGGGFTELIRGITRLPTAADVQSLMQARSVTTAGAVAAPSQLRMSPTLSAVSESPVPQETRLQQLELYSTSVLLSPAPEMDDGTLPLLPNFPSKFPMPPVTMEAEAAGQQNHGARELTKLPMDCRDGLHGEGPSAPNRRELWEQSGGAKPWQEEKGNAKALSLSLPSQPLSHHPPVVLTNSPAAPGVSKGGVSMDNIYLQQVYGGSTDPVLLVDASCEVLWFNKAYERALKSVLERQSSQPAVTGPYIDPLGHPTPLGNLVLNQGGGDTKPVNATLWGFLRKLVMPDVDSTPNLLRGMKLEASNRKEPCKLTDTGQLHLSVGDGRGSCSMLDECSKGALVCRMDDANDAQVCVGMGKLTTVTLSCVGMGKLTTVTLESITEVHMGQGAAVIECVETAEVRLGASGSSPAFITDCTSRVRWVNASFKQMLGHSEQQSSCKVNSMHPCEAPMVMQEPPELTFVGAAEKIPWSAWAFSGLVNLEWLKAGKRRSMTVPCDVSRLAPAATWVWKFDLGLSLSLNLCA